MPNEDFSPEQLEGELGRSLRRVDAPPDFSAGVLRRLQMQVGSLFSPEHQLAPRLQSGTETETEIAIGTGTGTAAYKDSRLSRVLSRGSPPHRAFGMLAAGALLFLLPLGGYLFQRHREAEAAARQFTLAMRLTHGALHQAFDQALGPAFSDAGQRLVEQAQPAPPK